MAMRTRMAAVGVGATALETGAGLWALAGLGPARITVFLLACAATTSVVTLLMWRLLGRPPREGEGPGPDGGPQGEDPQPPWWPEFEQDFWRHVRSERTPL